MILELEPWAVVAGEDNQGIFMESCGFDFFHDAADFCIDVLDRAGVCVGGIWMGCVFRNEQGDVWHAVGEVEEERTVLIGFDEIDGAIGVAAGDGPLVDRHLDDGFIFNERGVPERHELVLIRPNFVTRSFCFCFVVRVVHVVGVGDSVVGIETQRARQGLGVVAEVPFADRRGGVSGGFEVVGEGVFVRVDSLFTLGEEDVLFEVDPFWITSSQQCRAGGGADGGCDKEVGEATALSGEAVEVGGGDFFRSVTGEVVVAEVVYED